MSVRDQASGIRDQKVRRRGAIFGPPPRPGGPQYREVARILEIPLDEARALINEAWEDLEARQAAKDLRSLIPDP